MIMVNCVTANVIESFFYCLSKVILFSAMFIPLVLLSSVEIENKPLDYGEKARISQKSLPGMAFGGCSANDLFHCKKQYGNMYHFFMDDTGGFTAFRNVFYYKD